MRRIWYAAVLDHLVVTVRQVPAKQLDSALRVLHFQNVTRVLDPGACRCDRGCWHKGGFSVHDLTQTRYKYIQLRDNARWTFLAQCVEKSSGTASKWLYYLPPKPQQEVCSQFFVKALGISHNKLPAVRTLVATGTMPGPHGNTGKTYVTKTQAKSVVYAFWASFFDDRCQKPSEDLWLAPTQLPTGRPLLVSPPAVTAPCVPGHTHNAVDAMFSGRTASILCRL